MMGLLLVSDLVAESLLLVAVGCLAAGVVYWLFPRDDEMDDG